MKRLTLLVLLACLAGPAQAQDLDKETNTARAAAVAKGRDWLTKNQADDGSWGKTYTVAVTSFACLTYLSAADEPFQDADGKALVKGLDFLLKNQTDGMFVTQGHSWIHGQGYATLALAEAYGRSLLCKVKPDIDTKKLKDAVAAAIKIIGKNQSDSGGWWYTPGSPGQHEGSTTVCAVQAIVSASNFGIPIDEKVLEKGFEYLKKCQNKDGSFQYQLGDGSSMKEGTAAGVATLGLMQKFDFQVMISGYEYLLKLKPETISNERFPYYGHFYGSMGMRLLYDEYKVDKNFRENTTKYIAGVQKELLSGQQKDGTWPVKGYMVGQENEGYSTSYAMLGVLVPEGRLSIYNREPPKLPKDSP